MLGQDIDYKLIGKQIRNVRKERNITQDMLSQITSLSVNHISHIETGASALSLPALLSICRALDTTADRLLYDNLPVSNQTYLNADIAQCFQDITKDESAVMLAVANAAKDVMRTQKASQTD